MELTQGKPGSWAPDLRGMLRPLVLRGVHDAYYLLAQIGLAEQSIRLLPVKAHFLPSQKRLWLACLAVTSVVLVYTLVRLSPPSSASSSLFHFLPAALLSTSCTEPPRWSGGLQWSASSADVAVAKAATVFALPPRCPIFTFFQPVEQLSHHHADERVEAWRAWYYSRGWQPVVLNTQMAMTLPHASQYAAAYAALPTVNPVQYELNCFLRWMAIAQRPGGGLFLDYDIFDMTPRISSTAFPELAGSCTYGRLTTYANHRPMIAHGNGTELLRWVRYMAAYRVKSTDRVGDRPHISDMIMARQTGGDVPFAERRPVPWFHFSHYALDRLKPYAPGQSFQNRMLHLHFLASRRVVSVGQETATRALVRALTMCGEDEWTAETEAFCDFRWMSTGSNDTHYVEPTDKVGFRSELCALIRPRPWRLSDVACRYQEGVRGERLQSGEEQTGEAEDDEEGAEPFLVAVVVDPVVQALRAMAANATERSSFGAPSITPRATHVMALTAPLSDSDWLAALQRTQPNPFLVQLTGHLPPCSSNAERWSAALSRITDIHSTMLIAEADVAADSVRMRRLVQRFVGFDVAGLDGVWAEVAQGACDEGCREAVAGLTAWQVSAVQAWHVLDVELHRLVEERFAAREAEWGRL